jgi:hypothetical protein
MPKNIIPAVNGNFFYLFISIIGVRKPSKIVRNLDRTC